VQETNEKDMQPSKKGRAMQGKKDRNNQARASSTLRPLFFADASRQPLSFSGGRIGSSIRCCRSLNIDWRAARRRRVLCTLAYFHHSFQAALSQKRNSGGSLEKM
jgi:hypothetical protein